MKQWSFLLDDLIDSMLLYHYKINGKLCFDNTRSATVTQRKSPQLKTTYWKCPLMSVYINTINEN